MKHDQALADVLGHLIALAEKAAEIIQKARIDCVAAQMLPTPQEKDTALIRIGNDLERALFLISEEKASAINRTDPAPIPCRDPVPLDSGYWDGR